VSHSSGSVPGDRRTNRTKVLVYDGIGVWLDRPHSSIQRIIAEPGGIRPAERTRAPSALTLAEREEVAWAIAGDAFIRSVAARRGRSPSTDSREIKRNGGRDAYRANLADQAAWDRAKRP
jgi:Helix-turn-helix domain